MFRPNLPNGWERCHRAVDTGDLSIATESNDLPLANVHLCLSKDKVGGATMLAITTIILADTGEHSEIRT